MRLTDYILLAIVAGALLLKALVTPAHSHGWYDKSCCSDNDCAPVEKIEQVPEGLKVTTKHGTVIVPTNFTRRPSQDSDFHACIGKGDGEFAPAGEPYLICFYEPSGS